MADALASRLANHDDEEESSSSLSSSASEDSDDSDRAKKEKAAAKITPQVRAEAQPVAAEQIRQPAPEVRCVQEAPAKVVSPPERSNVRGD